MATIGSLKYQITADSSQLNAAMVATKAQLREAAKVMRESVTPAQELQSALDRTQKLYELGVISLEAYGQKMVKLKSSTPEAIAQQKAHNTAVAEAKAITERNMTAQDHYNASLERLNVLKPHLSLQTYEAELLRLQQTLPSVIKQQQDLAKAQSEAAAITARNMTAQDHFNASLERLNALRPHLSVQTYEAELLRLQQTLPSVVKQQQDLARAQSEAAAITARNQSAQERYSESLKRLNELKPHLSSAAYNAELRRLQSTLPDVAAKEQRRNQLISEARALTASVETAEEKRASALNRIDQLLRRGAISQETYNRAIGREMASQDGVASRGSSSRLPSMPSIPTGGGIMGGMGSMASMVVGGGLMTGALMAGREIFQLTAQVEMAGAAFEVLIGDASRANQMIAQMKSIDKNSMLDFNTISKAGKTLLGYGTAAETVIPSLDALSEISMGNAQNFDSLALAFGQVQAKGRLTGEEVRQMVNAGFNPLQEIARTTGQTLAEVEERMKAGGVSADMVTAALTSATSAGGRFNDMNEKLGKTGAGQLAKLGSDAQTLAITLGSIAMPVAIESLKSARGLVMGTNFVVSTMAEGFSLIGATVTGNLNAHLDAAKATQDQAHATQVAKEMAEQQAIATESAAAAAKKNAEWWATTGRNIQTAEGVARGVANAQKAAEEFAQLKRDKFKSERDSFFDEVKRIEDEYQKLTLGEEKYKKLQQDRKLFLTQDAKVLGGNEDALRRSAEEKLAAIKRIEADQLAIKEREKAEKEAAKKREQEEKAMHDKRLSMAEEIVKKNNPAAGLARRLMEIDDLRKRGMIDSANHLAARNSAITEATNQSGNNTSATAATITRGSVEEYKQRYNSEKQGVDKQLHALARQTTLAQAQLEQQKITNEKLSSQPQLMIAR